MSNENPRSKELLHRLIVILPILPIDIQGLNCDRMPYVDQTPNYNPYFESVEFMTVTAFQQANQLLREGKLEVAVVVYRQAIEQNPQFYGAYQNLGETLGKLGHWEEAVEAYRRAVQLKPGAAWSNWGLSQALQQVGRLEEAQKVGDLAIEIDPKGHHQGRLVMASDAGKPCPRVGVCGWELSHNAAGRAYTLARLYGSFAEVELIGCLFPKYGGQVWEPIRGNQIPCHTIRVEDEGRFIEQALDLVWAHPYEVVHLSKPRMPNIILGLLYKLLWGARVIVDIDDEELVFVKASEPLDLAALLESEGKLPPFRDWDGGKWTRLAVGLARAFDGVTVANVALQKRYGGVVIRHARDEEQFVPSADLKRRSRERFGIAQDKKVVLFFGTPKEYKGLVATARALASLGRKDVVFAIIGDFRDGKLKEELQSIPGVDYLFVGNQPFESIPDVVAVGDICVLLQDVGSEVSRFQIPAKLSDALGMGLVVLLSETAAVADVIGSGAVVPVAEGDLAGVLGRVLSDQAECDKLRARGRELLAAEFGFGVNEPRLAAVMDGVRRGVGVLSDELNLLLAGFPAVPDYFGGRGDGVLLLQQAQTAMDKGEWSEAAGCWRKLWKVYGLSLSPEVLISISNSLFKLDAFTEAEACLKRVLASNPQHPKALEVRQNQYFYHTYSSWLMKTVEGIIDWYKADGLETPPNWETAAKLYQPFIDSKQSYGAISQSVKTHLLLAEEYWERQDHENAIKSLKKSITFFGNRLPASLINSIVTSVDVIRKNQVNSSEDLTSNIKQEIHHTNIGVLSVNEWLLLYDVLSWNGLFESGFVARQKAIEQAHQQGDAQPNNITALMVAARAAIDQGDFTAASRFINKLAKTNCNSQQLSELRAYKYLQEGDIEGFRSSWPYPPRLADLRFQEYIRGKSVAVVGPAPTGMLDGEEIDSFDVVIRFNYRGEGSIGDAREYGTKTNISLYNAHTIRYFVDHNQLNILSNLDFSLIRRPRHDVDALAWDKNKIRLIYETDNIFYKSLNGVPAVLFDVLLQGADKVKLFKTNFYLTSQHHHEKYRGRNDADFAEFPLGKIQPILANHDLVSQVGFTRSLWKAGLVDVDQQCATVLDLSEADYLGSIENLVIKECSEVAKQSANYARLQNTIGKSLENQKKYELALEKYNYAISIDPKCHEFHKNHAAVCFNLGKRSDGVTSISRAILLKNSNDVFNDTPSPKLNNSLKGIVFISSLKRPLYGMNRSIVQISSYLKQEHNIILDFTETGSATFLIELYEKFDQYDFLLFNSAASLILLLQFPEIFNALIKLNIPIFIYWHETEWAMNNLGEKFPKYAELISSFSNHLVFHLTASNCCSIFVSTIFKGCKSRIFTVYECIDEHTEDFPDSDFVPLQSPFVLNIASIQDRKGTDLFIESAIKVCHKHPTVKFVWLGKEVSLGSYSHKAGLARIEKAGLNDRIIFPGFADNPYQYLKTASLVFLSSRDDPFPLTILEAMSCGRQIITFDVGGAPEAIGEEGIIIKPFDTDAAAQSILASLDKPTDKLFKPSMQKRYLNLYTPEKFAIRLDSCIRQSLQRVKDWNGYQLSQPSNFQPIVVNSNVLPSNTHKECFIIGSGRSLLSLTRKEKEYLANHPNTLALNKYLLFYEKIGVLPKSMFAADSHYPSPKLIFQTIDKIECLGNKITYYLDEYYRKLFVIPPQESVWSRKRRDKMFEENGYVAPLGFDYSNLVFFKHQFGVYSGFSWAKTLKEPLYWFHTSLLTAINLANIIYPNCDIKLLGIDLQSPEAFYHEEIMKKEEMLDKHYRKSIKELGKHPTAIATTSDGRTMFDALQRIVLELDKLGTKLLCCNPNSKLVLDGICKYTSIIV